MICNEKNKCGGCFYTNVDYKEELQIKEQNVKEILKQYINKDTIFESILSNEQFLYYKNKLEFSFGDTTKDGKLVLGFHQKNSFFNICEAINCELVEEDVRKVVKESEIFFRERNISYRHKKTNKGYLRHLVIRRSYTNNELLVNLITTSSIESEKEYYDILLKDYVNTLLNIDDVKYAGICHTNNDSLSDKVLYDNIKILYGKDYIYEELFGLKFKISFPSFFQTNTNGAKILYKKVKEYADINNDIILDLYCGTGTISQIVSKDAKQVYGIEIVDDAIKMANENVLANNIKNITFVKDDVLLWINKNNNLDVDLIILDPPRSGVNPKALQIISNMNAKKIIYISCKCESLSRDLFMLTAKGYKLTKVCPVDMFPRTDNIEVVALLIKI
ncbi:MAG: 23S rRNA (uracil(1939)-C(5))-methyltransferase RlmD [Eubacteriales bacterium]|nr:23S rRNA (uracil(1939)-C(5))-methyltransferase RlmD [Eubacteriales bacterium]